MWSIFGKEKKTQSLRVERNFEIMTRVEGMGFFPRLTESKNGKYLFAWIDGDRESGRGGYREEGLGSYILAENDIVIVSGDCERPNDGKVANNGTFIFNDSMFGPELRGNFHAYDKSGQCILVQHFTANLIYNGISDCGGFAICQLANSETEDSGVMAFFDLSEGTMKWKLVSPTGWATEYNFSVSERKLTILQQDGEQFNFDFDGNFLDQEKLDQYNFEKANGFDLHSRANELLQVAIETDDLPKMMEVYNLLEVALTRNIDKYPNEQASIHRQMGEIQEGLNNSLSAIKHYEVALSLNPRVGLKRKLDLMKKN